MLIRLFRLVSQLFHKAMFTPKCSVEFLPTGQQAECKITRECVWTMYTPSPKIVDGCRVQKECNWNSLRFKGSNSVTQQTSFLKQPVDFVAESQGFAVDGCQFYRSKEGLKQHP